MPVGTARILLTDIGVMDRGDTKGWVFQVDDGSFRTIPDERRIFTHLQVGKRMPLPEAAPIGQSVSGHPGSWDAGILVEKRAAMLHVIVIECAGAGNASVAGNQGLHLR